MMTICDRLWKLLLTITCLSLCVTASLAAELRFSRYFGDDMVLQRDKPVTVTGFADKGSTVTVVFGGQTSAARAGEDGAWQVTLGAMPANAAPQKLVATSSVGNAKLTIDNVVVGDVLLVARQTSIDISLGSDSAGRKAAAAHKDDPLYRAIVIKTVSAATPQADLAAEATTGWSAVSKETAPDMTAAAYYLGRDLVADVKVPVGIIDLNLGSAFPISWLNREALEETEKFYGNSDVPGQLAYFDERLVAEAEGVPMPKQKVAPSNTVEYTLFPAGGFNGVINPLKGVALKAAIVQLGNDYPYMIYADILASDNPFSRPALNTAYVDTYNIRKVGFRMESKTTPRVPRVWRAALGEPELPLGLIVPPGSDLNTLGQHHREMRELQRHMAEDNPNVGIILPGSENTPFSAQPQDEALLAKRALSWVQGAVYKKPGTPATGPLFDRIEVNINKAIVHFADGTGEGLRATGDALEYFEVAGIEGDYVPAQARIEGAVVRLQSDTVNRIKRVRYNWNQRPNQGLVNAAGLPAIPFRSERLEHHWFVTNQETDLPVEYSTPANEWAKNDVTLINGQLKTHGYGNFSGWIGPIGVRTGPFGPNMGVREVKAGSPAAGKVFVDDVIYSANGNMLGDAAWLVMADAITESETEAGGGKLTLGLRRDGKNVDVDLTIEVMGTYSSTAPYDCPKTEKIIRDLEEWTVAHGAGAGFLNNDALFMLATGDPEMLVHVRRIVQSIIKGKDPTRAIEPTRAGKSWHNSAEAILLGEYYLATGDRSVLPHLKHACDRLAATQNESGGWRHNYPGGAHYGFIPNAGLPGVIGMNLAKEAGVDINLDAYELGLKHFGHNRAETGYLIYGSGGCEREVPVPFAHETMMAGKMTSYNGGLSAAGILMGLAGNHRAAHMCSLISAYAWNNTFGGHGGNFWNNFWTPLGAHQHSKSAFIHFWKQHRWYRECNRMFDGSLIQHESGKVGAACGLALVAPRRRIQIVGAPPSPFAADAPAILKPALDTYWNDDYAGCEKLVDELIASGTVGMADLPTVEYLGRAARDMQAMLALDVAAVAPANPETPEPAAAPDAEKPRAWQNLVTAIGKDATIGKVPAEEANVWGIEVVEALDQAPEGWMEPGFDDSEWKQTALPISWRMYHTALLRTTFNVDDKKAFDGLLFRGWVFRQQGIEIYLNGTLIGKVNNLEKKTGNIENMFKDSAVKLLKNGENTLAVTTRHNWRWGMLFMRVYNDGFDFRLAGRLAE